jgi:two-component system nitrogen regulation response regulator NtrX
MILAPGDRIGRIDLDMLPPEVLGKPGRRRRRQRRQCDHGRAAQGSARDLRARISARPDPPLSGNISRTASFIGMERSALHRKLKLLGMADTKPDGEE